MAEIVNLRRARKSRAGQQKEAQAAENRIRFGRTKQERERPLAEARLASDRLSGHQLPPPDDADPES